MLLSSKLWTALSLASLAAAVVTVARPERHLISVRSNTSDVESNAQVADQLAPRETLVEDSASVNQDDSVSKRADRSSADHTAAAALPGSVKQLARRDSPKRLDKRYEYDLELLGMSMRLSTKPTCKDGVCTKLIKGEVQQVCGEGYIGCGPGQACAVGLGLCFDADVCCTATQKIQGFDGQSKACSYVHTDGATWISAPVFCTKDKSPKACFHKTQAECDKPTVVPKTVKSCPKGKENCIHNS